MEKNWKNALVQYTQAKNDAKAAKRKVRNDNANKHAKRVAAIQLIFNKEEIQKLKGEKLKDHFLAYRQAGAPIP
jgi:hypothetical protein